MREEKQPAVYVVASQRNGTNYIGVTSALWNRIATHKSKTFSGFTARYNVSILVWYEHHHDLISATVRENQLKGWNRQKKFKLIEAMNPTWEDLHEKMDSVSALVEV